MAPNYKYEFLLTDIHWEKYADKSFTIKVKYQNSTKKVIIDEFVLDFSVWKDLEMVNPRGFSEVVDELEKIKTAINELKKKN